MNIISSTKIHGWFLSTYSNRLLIPMLPTFFLHFIPTVSVSLCASNAGGMVKEPRSHMLHSTAEKKCPFSKTVLQLQPQVHQYPILYSSQIIFL